MKPSSRTNNPHDAFFREAFSRAEVARSFISEYLPTALLRQADFRTLVIAKDSYVDEELSQHFSDILYRVNLSGKPSFIYLLFEHKSFVDRMIAFQLLRNMVKIWEGHLKQEPRLKTLPVIVPIVVYHGRAKWDVPNNLLGLFDEVAGTRQYIPDFSGEIFDISHIPDESIKGAVLIRALLLLMKYVKNPSLLDAIPGIFQLINDLGNKTRATEYIELFLRYLMSTIETDKKEVFTKEIVKTLKEGGTIMPTIAESYIQEGIERGFEKGIEKGFEKGIEKGIENGKLDDAEKMIALGMSTGDIRKITGLSRSQIDGLRKKRK